MAERRSFLLGKADNSDETLVNELMKSIDLPGWEKSGDGFTVYAANDFDPTEDFNSLTEQIEKYLNDNRIDDAIDITYSYRGDPEILFSVNRFGVVTKGTWEAVFPENPIDCLDYELVYHQNDDPHLEGHWFQDRVAEGEDVGGIYGVIQSHCGHEYRWLFTKLDIELSLYEQGIRFSIDKSCCEDISWPMGGSNSSATSFEWLETDDDIRRFLTEGSGPDVDDPQLIDIGEFLLSVEVDLCSCTQEYLDKYGLNKEDLVQNCDCKGYSDKVEEICKEFKKKGWDGFDYKNPYYGKDSNMRFSELCELYERYKNSELGLCPGR